MKPLILSAIAVALIAAKAPVDIGPEPTFQSWQAIVEARLNQTMLDYPSARIEWADKVVRRKDGWWSCFGANGKNSYGAYTGWQWGMAYVKSEGGQNVRVNISFTPNREWNREECESYLNKPDKN